MFYSWKTQMIMFLVLSLCVPFPLQDVLLGSGMLAGFASVELLPFFPVSGFFSQLLCIAVSPC